eukprot:scaffold290534_cov20-Prasinocladus_malaysianus.AAC.2
MSPALARQLAVDCPVSTLSERHHNMWTIGFCDRYADSLLKSVERIVFKRFLSLFAHIELPLAHPKNLDN